MNKKFQYLGFKMDKKIPVAIDNKIYIRDSEYNISNFKLINFIYDKNDLMISEQSTIYSKQNLLYGEYIFNSNKDYMGIITNKLENRYSISQENDIMIRINNVYNVNIKNQEFPILYCDKEFPNNDILMNYLKLVPQRSRREITIYRLFMKTIIIIHENERNIGEIIFNNPCISEYLGENDNVNFF
ncbi:unknown similar to AMEV225 [Choristoneura rosaceana entomopoxvirus 'L']|uniref:Uncharacterized protein n=1 Tax=Choristoneura rosaceana entomopoxvirus 'L' TaxID=1293539 RepID=A0ABM9QKR9_9POXV|nr:unknown similar to AMEV225 [Choristoneura rosaceana entomopoxvirus 'L']CCU56130.1 unknown similar to AMEV225 [Choristoneura rosaceana entomopoxvirus 'L']